MLENLKQNHTINIVSNRKSIYLIYIITTGIKDVIIVKTKVLPQTQVTLTYCGYPIQNLWFARTLVLCVSFVVRCLSFCTFSFGHYVVQYTDSDYPFGIFKLFLDQLFSNLLTMMVPGTGFSRNVSCVFNWISTSLLRRTLSYVDQRFCLEEV